MHVVERSPRKPDHGGREGRCDEGLDVGGVGVGRDSTSEGSESEGILVSRDRVNSSSRRDSTFAPDEEE